MDPRLLKYYNQELHHVREMGSEFAKEFPKIAGRLGMDGIECADPYVERLLEGFAFLAARVQLKVDAEFPNFTQHLFELIYPHYLAPTPSMTVVQFQPDLDEGGLAAGFTLPRGTEIQSMLGKGDQTNCTYTTAHELQLWPLELTEAKYFSGASALANIGVSDLRGVKAGIRLRFRTTAGVAFDELSLDRLPLYVRGAGELPKKIYEQLLANCIGTVIRPKGGKDPWQVKTDRSDVSALGFSNDKALLPYTRRSFHGYRLLQEYFAFPERFLFVELGNLQRAIRRCSGTELEIIVLLNRSVVGLDSTIDEKCFVLNCSPAINLFNKTADRIHVDRGAPAFHVLPDRTRPLDFEVYSISEVRGHGGGEDDTEFRPFYSDRSVGLHQEQMAYYTAHREPRMLSTRQRKIGSRASYVGSEVYLSLVDAKNAPFSSALKQISIKTTCTNRDLPLQIPIGKGTTDFTMETGAPVESIRCLAGPTKPRPSLAHGNASWRLISHLSLNYMSLVDGENEDGASALRELLSLYADESDAATERQIEGVKSVSSQPITRRLPTSGPISFGRGLEITLNCEDGAFEGTGVFLLGSVLEEFFARHVSMNSFTETVLRTDDRGEVARWPARIGRRPRL
ncbi:MAG: type VI secretion system baseplate subunit TssF [Gammaproteobacteria bacterium]|nr:type VI secretion system baseplate subunit TssF [Gammaproteobacteria bacterium]